MSDWFITPAIENAVIVLATIPTQDEAIDPDQEQDFFSAADWIQSRRLLLQLQGSRKVTPYLFFDPPEAEDAMDRCLADYPPDTLENLAVAAQPFGPLSTRFSGCFRRIFSRNETRRAVAIVSGEPYANPTAIDFALEALADRCDFILGLTADSRLMLVGTTSFIPGLLDGLPVAKTSNPGLSSGVDELLRRLRERGLRHEILPFGLT